MCSILFFIKSQATIIKRQGQKQAHIRAFTKQTVVGKTIIRKTRTKSISKNSNLNMQGLVVLQQKGGKLMLPEEAMQLSVF